jgi:hypothetical protein
VGGVSGVFIFTIGSARRVWLGPVAMRLGDSMLLCTMEGVGPATLSLGDHGLVLALIGMDGRDQL